jgi:hypothetical protein
MNTENWTPPQNGECIAEQSKIEAVGSFFVGLILGIIVYGFFALIGEKIAELLNHSLLGKVIDGFFGVVGVILGFYSLFKLISNSNLLYLNNSILDSDGDKELDSKERFYLIKGQLKLSGKGAKYLIPKRFKINPEKLVAFLNAVQENRESKEKEEFLRKRKEKEEIL